MIALIRIILIGFFILLSSVVISLLCLLRPKNPKNTYIAALMYGRVAYFLGFKVSVIGNENIPKRNAIFVCNHQSNYDVFIATNAVIRNTVSVGKKSILYFPFFGLMYWLSGNILIDRSDKNKAINSLIFAQQKIKSKNLSLWFFPEGTRNYAKQLYLFKSGAFHLAYNTGVPIVPVCISLYYKKLNLNRINNGEIIIKYLPAVYVNKSAKESTKEVYLSMKDSILELEMSKN
ncbi:1-acylglycerol-3-phosphate O-acyltransferase [Pasteurella testudinis]|uniref:1-acylglycerol-3-phosphate O-acyltransferase n=1 Tax=Pasteurella testudinis TaxID=761 RepID=UPI004059565B